MYITTPTSLKVGDQVAYHVASKRYSGNFRVGVLNRDTGKFLGDTYSSKAGQTKSNTFQIMQAGRYSFTIINDSNYSDNFYGDWVFAIR